MYSYACVTCLPELELGESLKWVIGSPVSALAYHAQYVLFTP